MSRYQRSLLDQQEAFLPMSVPQNHEMVILSRALDWDLAQVIGETNRDEKVKSTRGLKPHYRALNGAVVVRALKGCDYRSTEDLIRNYGPARFLCDLQNSHWTPDHNTIWEYEQMLGEKGIQELTDYALRTAAENGFADPRGLCSDTTAQEANIPYPNEVGHMNSFMKSVRENLETLLKNSKGLGRGLVGKMKEAFADIGKKVRGHRLFAKTKETKKEISQKLSELTENVVGNLGNLLEGIDVKANQVRGSGKRALNNLSEDFHNMCRMLSQIKHWIKTGKVVKGKILSLFNPDFRAINRGKMGKQVEFGLKWGINQIRGGYVSVFMCADMMNCDATYAVRGVEEHIRIFGEPPRDFGFDRAGWSKEHKKEIRKLGVKNLGIAPKGQAKWEVGPRVKDRMTRERAQVEGKIGTMKRQGFNKSEAKTNLGVRQSALRAALGFNLRRLAKDITMSAMVQTARAL
jgi:transposase, IS5 family